VPALPAHHRAPLPADTIMSTSTDNLRQLPLTNTDASLHLSTSAVSQHPSTAADGPRPSTTAAVGLRPLIVGDVEPTVM